MSRRTAYRVTSPIAQARYFRSLPGAARHAVTLLEREECPEGSRDYGYWDGVAVWQRARDEDGWLAIRVQHWLELGNSAAAA
jgi:hypothetical protein